MFRRSSSEQITDGLKLWRKTVSECTSAAQLAMCVNMLRECIAWEKSIMKVVRHFAFMLSFLTNTIKCTGKLLFSVYRY